mmetsp:Transcript_36601/g.67077  ORF Transcript_36601/g.67077 Transcript_36601/m.67077 type:complete len:281 (-) Transcript_36601:39-881(-)
MPPQDQPASPPPVPTRPGKPARARGAARRLPPLEVSEAQQVAKIGAGAFASPLPWFPPSLELAEGLYGTEMYPTAKARRLGKKYVRGGRHKLASLNKDDSLEALPPNANDDDEEEDPAEDMGVVDVEMYDDTRSEDSESDVSESHPFVVGMLIDNYVRGAMGTPEAERGRDEDVKSSPLRTGRGNGRGGRSPSTKPGFGETQPRQTGKDLKLQASQQKPVPPLVPAAPSRAWARPAPEVKREMPTLDDLLKSPPTYQTSPLPQRPAHPKAKMLSGSMSAR